MNDWIDITVPLQRGLPQWPGDPLFEIWKASDLSEGANVTALSLCAHTGTHMDAPLHYVKGGTPIDEAALDVLVGPAIVATLNALPRAERILFRTTSSARPWWREAFREDAECLTVAQARSLVEQGTRLIGIDYLSIGDAEVHTILLQAGVLIVEGLDLSKAEPGEYDLVCLPLKLAGADGAPARAILRKRLSNDSVQL